MGYCQGLTQKRKLVEYSNLSLLPDCKDHVYQLSHTPAITQWTVSLPKQAVEKKTLSSLSLSKVEDDRKEKNQTLC